MKIKIIDLLNKIAKGEEIPNKISDEGLIYTYSGAGYVDEDYIDFVETLPINKTGLNQEVEVIEEDKKIEKLNDKIGHFGSDNTKKIINELNRTRTTINELIDEINKLKEDK